MSLKRDLEQLLKAGKNLEANRPDLFRWIRLLDEKRERGIVPRKISRVPTLQETERFGYEQFFGESTS